MTDSVYRRGSQLSDWENIIIDTEAGLISEHEGGRLNPVYHRVGLSI